MPKERKRALVTGGGSGIGRALALALAKQGHTVLILGRRQKPLAETAAHSPDHIIPIQADITQPTHLDKVAEQVKTTGKLAYLIHNAGVLGPVTPLKEINREDWLHHMDTNLNGPLFLTQAMRPYLERGARILHVSSGAAMAPIKAGALTAPPRLPSTCSISAWIWNCGRNTSVWAACDPAW